MKNANGRLLSAATGDRCGDPVLVARERTNTVVLQGSGFIPTVIPQVVDMHVKFAEEERPKGVVKVYGEAVSVAQDQTGAARISMTTHCDKRAVIQLDLLL